MLNSINLDDKSYEDLMSEALARIPLYSREWTNFNRSDPGITVLQNLSAFSLLQQGAINTVTDAVRRRLLALVGHTAGEDRAAVLLLQAPRGEPLRLPSCARFQVGEVCFETAKAVSLDGWDLTAAYVCRKDSWQDVTYLLDARAGSAAIFGPEPQAGDSFCCILNKSPATNHPLRLWVQTAGDMGRNPFPETGGPVFGKTRWQYYTKEGWTDAVAEDDTRGFLVTGAVTLHLNSGPPVPFAGAPLEGWALRCLLEEARYDYPPRVCSLAAGLFPVYQWETRSQSWRLPETGGRLAGPLARRGNLFVYCREEPCGPYREYRAYTGIADVGRFFLREDDGEGGVLSFDAQRFGFGPCSEPDAVLAVCCDDEIVHHRELGLVYGYEDQELELDMPGRLLPGGVTLLSGIKGADGELEWYVVPPDRTDPEELCYDIPPGGGKLCIRHPGVCSGARLVLCDCRVTRGAEGNIRAGTFLEYREEGRPSRLFYSPAPGRGGADHESVEALRHRFVMWARSPAAAVSAEDYEALAMQTPGLCIHKVRAVSVPGENLVQVAVKPRSEERLPALSPLYLAQLAAWMERHRMITTRVELLQPRYVPVDVRCAVYVKRYFGDARAEIEALLRACLDHVNGPQNFGARVVFHQIYQALLDMPCVEAVDSLRLHPVTTAGVMIEGPDLCLDERSLCYPGHLTVELHVHPAGRGERR